MLEIYCWPSSLHPAVQTVFPLSCNMTYSLELPTLSSDWSAGGAFTELISYLEHNLLRRCSAQVTMEIYPGKKRTSVVGPKTQS